MNAEALTFQITQATLDLWPTDIPITKRDIQNIASDAACITRRITERENDMRKFTWAPASVRRMLAIRVYRSLKSLDEADEVIMSEVHLPDEYLPFHSLSAPDLRAVEPWEIQMCVSPNNVAVLYGLGPEA